jgi:hypothetical protein
MSQLWIVIPLVTGAAVYVVWLLAPRSWRQRLGLGSAKGGAVAAQGTDANCGCGKKQGGCH